MRHLINWSLVVSLLLTAPAWANDKPAGWRWYNEPKTVKKPVKKAKPVQQNTVTRTMSATEQMKWFQGYHQEATNAAVIDPTNKDKVALAMKLNQFVSNQSSQFGMTFKQVLLEKPELSYIKDRPVEQAARSTYLQLEREKKERSIREMASQGWGFFFVYEGKDVLSQKLAPSVQQFANSYGLEVLGISKDGVLIDSIRDNRVDNKDFAVPYTPALLLVNPNTKEMKPLAYGFISQDALISRFHNAATNYQDMDF